MGSLKKSMKELHLIISYIHSHPGSSGLRCNLVETWNFDFQVHHLKDALLPEALNGFDLRISSWNAKSTAVSKGWQNFCYCALEIASKWMCEVAQKPQLSAAIKSIFAHFRRSSFDVSGRTQLLPPGQIGDLSLEPVNAALAHYQSDF